MSKKKKSARRPNIPAAALGGPAAPATTVPAPAAPGTSPRREAFAPDYEYIKKDLRRIGILAGSFIAILIILSFFIQ